MPENGWPRAGYGLSPHAVRVYNLLIELYPNPYVYTTLATNDRGLVIFELILAVPVGRWKHALSDCLSLTRTYAQSLAVNYLLLILSIIIGFDCDWKISGIRSYTKRRP